MPTNRKPDPNVIDDIYLDDVIKALENDPQLDFEDIGTKVVSARSTSPARSPISSNATGSTSASSKKRRVSATATCSKTSASDSLAPRPTQTPQPTPNRQAVEAFEAALVEIPQVFDAQRLFGEPDYLLHVITQDLPAFQRLYDDSLSTLPNVQRLTSTLVMKRVVQDRPLPL
jgi:hypothetical protein